MSWKNRLSLSLPYGTRIEWENAVPPRGWFFMNSLRKPKTPYAEIEIHKVNYRNGARRWLVRDKL